MQQSNVNNLFPNY